MPRVGASLTPGYVSKQVVPPSSMISVATTATWFTANTALMARFTLTSPAQFRYIQAYIGVSSGNIQATVGSVTRADATSTTATYTRIATSGVIACPTGTSVASVDVGAETYLPPGEYGLTWWCDNTTATFNHSLITGYTGMKLLWAATGLVTNGVTASATAFAVSTRYMNGLTLESAVY